MNREEILRRFRNKTEDLSYASVASRCHGKGKPMSDEEFYDKASLVIDEVLDALLELQGAEVNV